MSNTTTAVEYRWRDFFKIHPAAEVFPIMDADELRKLADDIQANGLSVPIETRSTGPDGDRFVVDGRNRLDAMELLGWPLVDAKGGWTHHVARRADGTTWRMDAEYKRKDDNEIVAEVISLNIHRRHLTKQQRVELIDKALRASRQHGEVTGKVVTVPQSRWVKGTRGSTKDEHKAAVVTEAAKAGISERTVERVLAKPETPKRKREPESAADRIDARLNRIIDEVRQMPAPNSEFGKVLIYIGKLLAKEGERLRMVKRHKP